jgi:hypothetical protein
VEKESRVENGSPDKSLEMKKKYLEILNKTYPKMTPKDAEYFAEIMRGDGLGKFKATFNLWGLLFGWLYLLYRRATIEAMGVLIISMLFFYISPIGAIILNSVLGGFFYHFLYLNKFARDLEVCGEFNPDIECMKRKAKPSLLYPIGALFLFGLVAFIELYPVIAGGGKQ